MTQLESVAAFRIRARRWISANLRRVDPEDAAWLTDVDDEAAVAHNRDLMRALFDAQLSGICFPTEYGGQGLTVEHLQAFAEEASGHELPLMFHLPTLTILAPTLLDFGTEEQKRHYIPAVLRGEQLWVQFLSEPSGGSDLAAARTRAVRKGDNYLLNGSKIWSSAAHRADYALCLCRTDWTVPKHAGLSMLIVAIHQPEVDVRQIRQVNGTSEFCQEFLDDVRVPVTNLVGAENDGWSVTTRLLQHEKIAVGGGSPFGLIAGHGGRSAKDDSALLVQVLRESGRVDDPVARQLIGESVALTRTQRALIAHLAQSVDSGRLPEASSSILKLFSATSAIRRAELGAMIAGTDLAASEGAARVMGIQFLARQGAALAGGSNEIQRNIIAERVLGMPREWAADRGVPFDQVVDATAGTRRPPTEH